MVKPRPGFLPRLFFTKKITTMSTLKELIKNPSTVVVDVRSAWEYEANHIPGAKNIPLEEVPYKVEEFKLFKNPVVLYCRSGNRSGMAVSISK